MRQLHLLYHPKVSESITSYPREGDNIVTKIRYDGERVFVNESQYFDSIPEGVWNFYVGGYQPAQKWLKDRRGHQLDFEDIVHYQRIIVALAETVRIMVEIGEIDL